MKASAPRSIAIAPASASPITFEDIAAFPPPGWQVPRQAEVAPDGSLFTYLMSESHGEQMALWAYDPASGEHRVLLRASDLVDSDKPMSREEELRRERQRQRIKGVTDYAWAKRANVLLVPLGGDVFVRGEDGAVKRLTHAEAPDIDPKICDHGKRVAFVRSGELFVVNVDDGRETQLTSDAPEGVTRGLSDFIAQEEMGEPSGMWWSPGCDKLAYLEVDERAVERIPVMGYRDGHDLQQLGYPRAGAPNPKVRLGLLDVASKRTRWIGMPQAEGFDPSDQYLGRVRFSADGNALYFQRLSRDQRRLALVRADTSTGKAVHILEERDPAWLELSAMRPLEDGRIVWSAIRDGHRHLELRDGKEGKLLATLTAGEWDVSSIAGVDEKSKRVLFIANKDAVLDRQLYAVPLEGGAIERLTREPGTHLVAAPHPEHGFVDIHSAMDRRPRAVIADSLGKTLGEIAIPSEGEVDARHIQSPELVRIDDGGVSLFGALLKPRSMQPGARYPAVVMVYGGPGVQTVTNEYNPRLLWQHLADRGIVVFQLDNRGSTGRGHAFQTAILERLGEVELEDQLRGLAYLKGLDFVDPDRVGIYGHSYGGYMAAMTMLRAPGRFQVAVSGSPVSDWRLYDTGYTERYMKRPQDNPSGYAASALPQDAPKLQGKLLIVHALMDENVHFEHTAKLIDALVAADKDFDLLVFPGERHGYRSPAARRYAYRRVVDYFAAHL